MSVEDKVKKIIAEKLSVDIAEVVPEASFVDVTWVAKSVSNV